MTIKTRLLLVCLLPLVLSACSSDTTPSSTTQADATPSPTARHGVALPFTISRAVINSAFQKDIKLAQITINVSGGAPPDWAATAIRVAENAVSLGADAADVKVDRADLGSRTDVPNMFLHYAEAYYGPNREKTPWGDKDWKPWSIFVSEHPVTVEEIGIYNDFQNLNQKLIDKGMDINKADTVAGKAVAKKYHLKPNWQLPRGNLSGKEFVRTDFAIDEDQSKDSLRNLTTCLAKTINDMLTGCGV